MRDAVNEDLKKGEHSRCEVASGLSNRWNECDVMASFTRSKQRDLIIGGVNYGMLLDDTRIGLHRNINDKFENSRIQDERDDRNREAMFKLKQQIRLTFQRPYSSNGMASIVSALRSTLEAMTGKPVPKYKSGTPDLNGPALIG